MSAPKVICCGELLVDYLADQVETPLADVSSWTAYVGGAPANVACGLSRLGTTAAFVGCLGCDRLAETLITTLEDLGVNCSGIQRHETAPTRTVYVTRIGGDRQFAGFGESETTAFADTRLQPPPATLFQKAQGLVIGTLAFAYPESGAALTRALELAQQYRLFRFIDVNWRPVFWSNPEAALWVIKDMLQQADFIKLSAEEAVWLLDTTDPSAIAAQYPQAQGVWVTDGPGEIHYWVTGASGCLPAFAVPTVDPTGAGDAFTAGLVHQLCQREGRTLGNPAIARDMTRFASAVGALTTRQAGAIAPQPTLTEVNTFLASQC